MRPQLDVRLLNSAKQRGKDLWDWSVWLEGDEKALDQIASVRYVLHHTFRDPVRVVTDRASKFTLKSNGWGEFLIRAEITPHSGAPFTVERWLTLSEGAAPDAPPQRLPTLFITSGATDGALVRTLKKDLTAQGVSVVIPEDDLEPGAPWRLQTADMIKASDAIAVICSGDYCDITELDVRTALEARKPVIPIVVDNVSVPSELESFQKIDMQRFGKTEAVTDSIVARVKDAFYPDESQ